MKKSIFLITTMVIMLVMNSCITLEPAIVAPATIDKKVEVEQNESESSLATIKLDCKALDSTVDFEKALSNMRRNKEAAKCTVYYLKFLARNNILRANSFESYKNSLEQAEKVSNGELNPQVVINMLRLNSTSIRKILRKNNVDCKNFNNLIKRLEYAILFRKYLPSINPKTKKDFGFDGMIDLKNNLNNFKKKSGQCFNTDSSKNDGTPIDFSQNIF